ncbi:hypothetical protein I5Q34_34045 [Streptomyces sp. AV19]|uniref:hypothetical protein n=1 Tax=Streptomyces sp. AV19 TaxID=2793068 RepID=UPI0018FEF4AC|nr:hypothetical protein [Streptomyces sp. AV19]MBH1939223.1 hypothetical protein [Streptomyces sp. AV19]MDG4537195.1 hypothetical protein [Streptomyces sp. AV19]
MSEEGEGMRPVFTCHVCGCLYMPPRTMRYTGLGYEASPLHCSAPSCKDGAEQIPGKLRAALEATAWRWAERWMDREPSALPQRARHRAARHTRPAGARSKLR